MRSRRLLPLSFMLLAFVGLCCAPTNEPDPGDTKPLPGLATADPVPETRPVEIPRGLQARVEAAIKNVKSRDLLIDHSFWTIFHGILGMGPSTELVVSREPRVTINAIDWITKGEKMPGGHEVLRGLEFPVTRWGLDVRSGPTFVGQGHQDQFISEMGQWDMPLDRVFVVNGKTYTFKDFCEHSKMRAKTTATPKQELSWAITIISQFFGTDLEWTNMDGEKLHFEDIVRYEMNEPIKGAACGGTHRLFGLTWALHLHLRRGGELKGVWAEAAKHLDEYKKKARRYQLPDGALSTNYFEQGNSNDKALRLSTSGHILEWLALVTTDAEIKSDWIQSAANAVSLMILENGGGSLDAGALYHATHGLHIYHARVFGGQYPHLLYPQPPR